MITEEGMGDKTHKKCSCGEKLISPTIINCFGEYCDLNCALLYAVDRAIRLEKVSNKYKRKIRKIALIATCQPI